MTRVAVASRSFSQHPVLRQELEAAFPRVTFNDDGLALVGDELVAFLAGHTHAIVGLEIIDAALLERLPGLEVIAKYGVGLDSIDLLALERFDVKLGWSRGVNRRSVAELTIGLALIMLHRAFEGGVQVRSGGWQQLRGRQMTGRVLGIIGCGSIGADVAALAGVFGCEILATDIRDLVEERARLGVVQVELDELLRRADVVTVHVPLTDLTRGMLTAPRLELMKQGAILLNTARGGIVDEAAVERLLVEGRLGGAAFDVFNREPPAAGGLLALPNFFPTPHIGGSTEEAVLAMGRAAILGLEHPRTPKEVRIELGETT